MTVGELIEKLKTYDSSLPVCTDDNEDGREEVLDVVLVNDYYGYWGFPLVKGSLTRHTEKPFVQVG